MSGEQLGGNPEIWEQRALQLNLKAVRSVIEQSRPTNVRLYLLHPETRLPETRTLPTLCDPANRAMLYMLYHTLGADFSSATSSNHQVAQPKGNILVNQTQIPLSDSSFFLETEHIAPNFNSFDVRIISIAIDDVAPGT